MKLLLATIALISVGIFVPNMYADNPTLTLNAQAGVGSLTESVAGDVYTWTYVDDSTKAGSYYGIIPWSTTDNNVFTAVFTYVPLGVSVLNVTDVCANLAVLATPNPCSLDFSFSDTAVGVGTLASNDPYDPLNLGIVSTDLDVAVGADVNIGVLNGLDIGGADIGGGSAQINFAAPAPTPEPGTLSLLGTGILGVAGLVRRKFRGR